MARCHFRCPQGLLRLRERRGNRTPNMRLWRPLLYLVELSTHVLLSAQHSRCTAPGPLLTAPPRCTGSPVPLTTCPGDAGRGPTWLRLVPFRWRVVVSRQVRRPSWARVIPGQPERRARRFLGPVDVLERDVHGTKVAEVSGMLGQPTRRFSGRGSPTTAEGPCSPRRRTFRGPGIPCPGARTRAARCG